MNRNKFLVSMLAILPLSAMAKMVKPFTRETKGLLIKKGEGRYHDHIQLKGVNANIIDIKISGKDTEGDLAIFEQTSLSLKRGTPLHVHPNQDEIFSVLEGEYIFHVGEDKHQLTAGDTIFLPRKVPHAWAQLSDKGRMQVTLQPAGKLEDFFVTIAGLTKEPTQAEMAQLFRDNDMELVGPPIKVD